MGNIPFIFNFFENSCFRKQIMYGFCLRSAVFKQYEAAVLQGAGCRIDGGCQVQQPVVFRKQGAVGLVVQHLVHNHVALCLGNVGRVAHNKL